MIYYKQRGIQSNLMAKGSASGPSLCILIGSCNINNKVTKDDQITVAYLRNI